MIFVDIALDIFCLLFYIFDILWKEEEHVQIEIFFLEEKMEIYDNHFPGPQQYFTDFMQFFSTLDSLGKV